LIRGPDGFPYLALYLPAENEPFTAFCISHVLDSCLEHGTGIVIAPDKSAPEWVFTYGNLWSLHSYNIFDATPQQSQSGEALKAGRKVLLAAPSEQFLPPFARHVLKAFLNNAGIASPRVMLVSGSNMSGKSTLLRAIGVNAVLAMVGAPIRGKSLRLSPLNIGTSIRRTDSLQQGRSAFYTEILQIRRVFQLTEDSTALLFLFDELLEGTNSKDRRIGAEGLLKSLLHRRAIGVVTTHDLALTEITDSSKSRIRNMHFEDQVKDGKMHFDYQLREGVIAKSNALELMRLMGFEL
jgi:hypothetical protein